MKHITPIIYMHINNMLTKEFNAKSVLIISVRYCQAPGEKRRQYCFRALIDLANGRSAIVEGIYSSGIRDINNPKKLAKPPSLAIVKILPSD